jgi:hypothetical protein
MAERTLIVDDSVLELIAQLYRHEDKEFKERVTFRDYLEISLRAYPEAAVRTSDFAQPFHAHQCACGTWVSCERPADADCLSKPRCRCCKPPVRQPLLLLEDA